MKPGSRALGVAASDGDDESTLCGALVRADRVVDDCVFGRCTVGGTDATPAVAQLFSKLGREDVQYLLLSGVAPAWFNLYDLQAIHETVERPVIAVSFETSEGLEPALSEHFSGNALDERLATYRTLPPRRRVEVNGETRFVRAVGVDDAEAAEIVRGFTPEGGRPEPLRVARLLARAGREYGERVESIDVAADSDSDGDDESTPN
ncbi:hypothetical protein SAMN04487949_0637 [Halogranum gelatinilyticum]|uniref:UPF0215 protein SAMN04487949_0637 n=1 Tax=Halogranum gelatinilyticum TaxID=660521 RepID=A0A1G9Q2D7_9EURY|nr:DUF99 family protein [Halogranum gelatinilyticum]SDM04657.1 hypothetical protein SAMN04487949_0637 [Halogranum gelatinilyticum]